MSDYATLFQNLLGSALTAVIERIQLAESLVAEADREEAWHLLSYSLKEPQSWEETRQLLLVLVPKMEQAGFREEWIAYLQAGVESGTQHHDLPAVAEFELQIALLYRMLSHYHLAVQWLQSGLTHFQTLNDWRGQARVLNEWAWVEQLRRNFDEATQHVEAALQLLSDDDPERGMCYRVQGMIAIYQGRWVEAEGLHRKALEIFERNGDQRKAAWSMVNVGIALNGQTKLTDAIDAYSRAATILKEIGDIQHWTVAQLNLGLAYYHLHKLEDALSCYIQAEQAALLLNDRFRLAEIQLNRGLAQMKHGYYGLADKAFSTSIQLYSDLGMIGKTINSMDGLAMNYIAQHEYQKALEIIEKAVLLMPQIVNDPNYQYWQQSLKIHYEETKTGLAMFATL